MLDPEIKDSPSLSIFKYRLKEKFKPQLVPSFFIEGDRFYFVHHARIRNKCSNLNADLFNNHLRNDSSCACGYINEDAEHYFFNCQFYRQQRVNFFNATRMYHPLNINTLLFGIQRHSTEENQSIFNEVHYYIKQTSRLIINNPTSRNVVNPS